MYCMLFLAPMYMYAIMKFMKVCHSGPDIDFMFTDTTDRTDPTPSKDDMEEREGHTFWSV